jgi:hypothetical protein
MTVSERRNVMGVFTPSNDGLAGAPKSAGTIFLNFWVVYSFAYHASHPLATAHANIPYMMHKTRHISIAYDIWMNKNWRYIGMKQRGVERNVSCPSATAPSSIIIDKRMPLLGMPSANSGLLPGHHMVDWLSYFSLYLVCFVGFSAFLPSSTF